MGHMQTIIVIRIKSGWFRTLPNCYFMKRIVLLLYSVELKHVGLVLVSNTTDHRRMARFSAGVGAGFTVLFTTFCK